MKQNGSLCMYEYDFRQLSTTRKASTIAFLIGLGIVLGFLLYPDNSWGFYVQSMFISGVSLAGASVVGGYRSLPETVDAYRKYRPVQPILLATLIGVATGVTSYVHHNDASFAASLGFLTVLGLSVVTLGGTWVVRRVTARGIHARDNRPSPVESETPSSYEARVGGASRRISTGVND